jgi:non-canonical purine NTP pyrophosphatase (RdgB/HAM1 family)
MEPLSEMENQPFFLRKKCMKPIVFITGNEGKLREVKSLIPDIQSVEMNLTEIQEMDAQKIILAKLEEARKHYPSTALLVEDTSLYLHALGGLPGPLVKWFTMAVGVEGIYKLTEPFGSKRATARTFIGYADEDGIRFFEGVLCD